MRCTGAPWLRQVRGLALEARRGSAVEAVGLALALFIAPVGVWTSSVVETYWLSGKRRAGLRT